MELMAFLDYLTPIADFFKPIFNLISECVTDKDLRAKLESEFKVKCAELEAQFMLKILDLQSRVIDAEIATGARWRSVCIYTAGAILAVMLVNNYILFPYFSDHMQPMTIPQELWWTFWGLTGLTVLDMIQRKNKNNKTGGE